MTQERKNLIKAFEKLFVTDPNPNIMAIECANIAENYMDSKILELALPIIKESVSDAFDRGFTSGYNAGIEMKTANEK